MEEIVRFETIHQYNLFNNHETLNPLISVIDFSKAAPRKLRKTFYGFYLLILKDTMCGDIRYGHSLYDYQEGTLVFIGPGQIFGSNSGEDTYQPKGKCLAFHPDLIKGTSLGSKINEYTFFSYQVNEALHVSEVERMLILDQLQMIHDELKRTLDKHSKKLIVTNLELVLNYCLRFYDRQFISRNTLNQGILNKFEMLLNEFFSTQEPSSVGLPSVSYFAEKLNLSPNYFGDLVRRETGKTALELIQLKLIDEAKERIHQPEVSVSEVAFSLGFKYPQHFTRLFKKQVGLTPSEYRNQISFSIKN